MRFVADEGVDRAIVERLRQDGHSVTYVAESTPGISDDNVLKAATEQGSPLITTDKDFGELIFSYGIENVSVMFMRYDQPQYSQIEHYFLKCLTDYLENPIKCFITISKNKIRIRKI